MTKREGKGRCETMAPPKRTIQGMQDIKTISGKPDILNEPYRAYMRITAIEMEKARKNKERESALHRVRNIEARFKEIEAEKEKLLEALDDRRFGPTPGASGEGTTAPHRGGFKFRY
jgi:flagellar motility protein MotE (MotC chaperone)